MSPLPRTGNPYLSRVIAEVRAKRPPLPRAEPYGYRYLRVPYGDMAWVWFITHGCVWDACTMCDYGKGPVVTAAEMVAAVEKGLAALDRRVAVLVVSPSGSMLDPREVPPAARRQIFALMARVPETKLILVETRADTITTGVLTEYRAALPGAVIGIQMGLETASAWIERYCVNKGSQTARFARAAQLIAQHDIAVAANVSVGTAFLSPAEAIADAERAVRWALGNGVDQVMLFPLHVKPHTLLAELYHIDVYRAPSLWALVEVLRRLGPELASKTNLSWYRFESPAAVIASPTSCEKCRERVLACLDEYRASLSYHWVEELCRMDCLCKTAWEHSLVMPTRALPDRVIEAYDLLSRRLYLQPLWRRLRPELEAELRQSFVPIVA